MDYLIRPAAPADAPHLVDLVKALITYLGEGTENFNKERFIDDAFGPEPQFSVLVAEGRDELAGYALFLDAYESSHCERGVYLADLYVTESARGTGLGKRLLQAVANDARARGRTYVWLVSPHEGARPFYDAIMDIRVEAVVYALTGDHFERLAADGLQGR